MTGIRFTTFEFPGNKRIRSPRIQYFRLPVRGKIPERAEYALGLIVNHYLPGNMNNQHNHAPELVRVIHDTKRSGLHYVFPGSLKEQREDDDRKLTIRQRLGSNACE